MAGEQNDALNTFGFINSQMRRNLIIAFLGILLGILYFGYNSLSSDKESCSSSYEELLQLYKEEQKAHTDDLKENVKWMREMEERQKELEFTRNKIQTEIKNLKSSN